jgi:hypothetical protein
MTAHGGMAMEPLDTPVDIAGVTQPHRVVPLADGAAQLVSGPLPLLAQPPAPGGPWGRWVSATGVSTGRPHRRSELLCCGATRVRTRNGRRTHGIKGPWPS